MKLADLVGKLSPEQPEKRKRLVVRNPSYAHIIHIYKQYCANKDWFGTPSPEAYLRASKALGNVEISPEELQQFTVEHIPTYTIHASNMLSAFISVLLNRCRTPELTLYISKPVDTLCMRLGKSNPKRVILRGNLGMSTGEYMMAGVLEIYGNVDALTGRKMMGGEIIINGNAAEGLGAESKDGIIRVTGTYQRDPSLGKMLNNNDKGGAKLYVKPQRK